MVVELGDGGDAHGAPHVRDPSGHPDGTRGVQDRAGGRMRADVDQVERVELDGPVEVTGPDHVDLVDRTWFGIASGWIGHALSHVAGRPAPRSRQARSGDDPFDGPTGRDGVHSHAPQLPGHRQGPVLGPWVGHEASTGVEDRLAQVLGRARRRRVRCPGAALRPCQIGRLLVGPGRPFAHPAAGASQRHPNLFGALARLTTPHRLFAQLLLGHPVLLARWEARSQPGGTMSCGQCTWPAGTMSCGRPSCETGTMSCSSRRNDVLRFLT